MIAEITYNVNQYIIEVGYDGSSLIAEVGYQTNTYYVEVLQGSGGGSSPAVWGGISGTLASQTDLQSALDGKQAAGSYAASSHSHTKAQITDFAHTHPISEVTGLQGAIDGKQENLVSGTNIKTVNNISLLGSGNIDVTGGAGSATWGGIGGTLSDQTDLQSALNAKAASTHSHAISDVTNLQSSLDAKAATSHSHVINDVTGLQSALDSKQASGSYATTSQVNAKQDLITGTDGQVVIKSGSTAGAITTGTLAYPDAEWDNITGKPSTFTPSAHSHPISDVTGLQTALDGKQATGSYATTSQVNAKQDTLVSGTNIKTINGTTLLGSGNIDVSGGGGPTAWGAITGTLADQTDLQSALNAKQAAGSYAAASHAHIIGDVTGLQSALDGKQASGSYANASHTHAISDTTGLQTALDGKAASSHTHAIADVTGLQTALDGKQASGSYASASHSHVIGDVTNLQTSLDGKQANITGTDGQVVIKSGSTAGVITTGTLAYPDADWANITNKPSTFAPSAHTHVKADITDFAHTHPQSDITNLTTDLAGKQATLVSATNIKTINGSSILGSGDLVVSGSGAAWGGITGTLSAQTDLQSALDGKQASGSYAAASHGHGIADVTGLQAAIDAKADIPSRSQMLVVETDFLGVGTPFAQGLAGAAVSSGTITQIAAEPNHPGIVELRDSTTAAGGYRIMTDVLAFRLAGGEKFVCVFQIRGARSTAVCRIGFQDSTSATAPADGVFLDFVGNGTTITTTGRARNNNTQTNTATTHSTALNTWYACIIELNSDATLATFSIYTEAGVLDWSDTVSTNIPTASGRETGAGVYVGESSTDAAAGIIRLDYLRIERSKTLVR